MGAKETWLRSVMAGICIAVGGAVNLSVDNKVVGAALFSAGLFTICTLGYYLYTGKVCYLLDTIKRENTFCGWVRFGQATSSVLHLSAMDCA